MLISINELNQTGVDFIMKSLAGKKVWESLTVMELAVTSSWVYRESHLHYYVPVRSVVNRYENLLEWVDRTEGWYRGAFSRRYFDTVSGCKAILLKKLPFGLEVPEWAAEYITTDSGFGTGVYNLDFLIDNEGVYLNTN